MDPALIEEIKTTAVKAASDALKEKYEEVKNLVTTESIALAESFKDIATMAASGSISKERAQEHVDMQKLSFQNILLTAKGIGFDLAQDTAVNVMKSVTPLLIKAGVALL